MSGFPLLRRCASDIDMVESLLADRMVGYWKMIKPTMLDDRDYQVPQLFSNFEWLNEEMVRR